MVARVNENVVANMNHFDQTQDKNTTGRLVRMLELD